MPLNAQISDFLVQYLGGQLATQIATGSSNVRLFTNTPTITIHSAVADFTEPSFTGYAPVAIGTPITRRSSNFDYQLVFPSTVFQATATPVAPVTVNGYFIDGTFTAVTQMEFAEYFATPFTFAVDLDAISFTIELQIPNQKVYGGYCSIC